MFIAIDIGNTHTVIGVFKKDTLIIDWRLTSTLQRTEDEIGAQVQSLLTEAGISIKKIDGIGISSVVPNLTDIYASMVQKVFSSETSDCECSIKSRNHNPL